jgi:imidazolonepropionase-like amidohydrolase
MFDGERFSTGGSTVFIDAGRIVAVEPGFPDVGDGSQVLQFDDATVLPGLIDAHVHLVADSEMGALDRVAGYTDDELDAVMTQGLHRQLAAGVTVVRDLGDRRYSAVGRRDRQRSGGALEPEPTILAAGPPLTTPGGHTFSLGGEVAGRAAISAAIAERKERGVDVVKVMASGGNTTPGTDVLRTQFTGEELTHIVDLAHAAGLPVTAHAHGLPAVEQAVDAGVDGIEHCTCLTATGFDLPDVLIERIAARGIAVSGVIPPPPVTDVDAMPPVIRALMARLGLTPAEFRALRAEMIGRLHRGGVRMVTGIDSGLTPWLAHGRVRAGVSFLTEAGCTPAAALSASTSLAADVCGLGKRKGLLRSGFDADVIVVGGNLQSDLGALADVRAVVLGGLPVR